MGGPSEEGGGGERSGMGRGYTRTDVYGQEEMERRRKPHPGNWSWSKMMMMMTKKEMEGPSEEKGVGGTRL